MLYGTPVRMSLDQMVRDWRGMEEQGQNTTIEFVQTLKANIQVVRDLAMKTKLRRKKARNSTTTGSRWLGILMWESIY